MAKSTKDVNKIGQEAWEKIQKEKLAPTPEIFHVWYAYCEGKSPDISHAVEMLKAKKGPIKDDDVVSIYRQFIDDRRQEHVVKSAGTQVYDTVIGLSTRIDELNENNRARGDRISQVTQSISVKDNSVKKILDTVVDDTKKILDDNTLLAQELDKSKMEMMALQQDLENVKREAATDSLTGLLNRKSFDESLEQISEASAKESKPFSLLMIDIDHFKKFNDTYGHQVGDQVLRLVASTLKKGVKGGDIVARYGGEEFGVILPNTPKESALKVAEHLRENVSSKDIINRGTGKVLGQIRLSVGVAESKKKEDLEDMIERADKALYKAKNMGRDQVIVAS
ncbi:MAG: GGDEF domain-containing protein [Bdellovibrionales bacterium]